MHRPLLAVILTSAVVVGCGGSPTASEFPSSQRSMEILIFAGDVAANAGSDAAEYPFAKLLKLTFTEHAGVAYRLGGVFVEGPVPAVKIRLTSEARALPALGSLVVDTTIVFGEALRGGQHELRLSIDLVDAAGRVVVTQRPRLLVTF